MAWKWEWLSNLGDRNIDYCATTRVLIPRSSQNSTNHVFSYRLSCSEHSTALQDVLENYKVIRHCFISILVMTTDVRRRTRDPLDEN